MLPETPPPPPVMALSVGAEVHVIHRSKTNAEVNKVERSTMSHLGFNFLACIDYRTILVPEWEQE
jgi:hypothetical protein